MDILLNQEQAERLIERRRRREDDEEPYERRVRQRFQAPIMNPAYEINVRTENDNPHLITITPIVTPNDVDESVLPYYVSYVLKREIIDQIKRVRPSWSVDYIKRQTNGFLTATSNGTSTVGASVPNLNRLNSRMILDLVEKIVQSQADVTVGQLTLAFTISPTIFRVGAGLKIPLYWNKVNKFTFPWQNFEDERGPLACAAIALCIAKDETNTPRINYHLNKTDQLLKDARELMDLMGWDTLVGIHQFKNFVIQYPEYRVTILREHGLDFSDLTFTGSEFEPTFTPQVTKYALYIFFDMNVGHYVPVYSPKSLYSKIRNNQMNWCHSCIKVFNYNQNHACSMIQRTAKIREKKCLKCGIYHQPGTGGCTLANCSNCKAVFPKRRGPVTPRHRCVLCYFPKDEKEFNTGQNDGKHPSLWVYDLESRVSTRSTSYFVKEAEMDEQGFYTGQVKIDLTYIDEQIPNLLIARNVFTDQVLEYFGDSCISDFCLFLLNHNRGNSICLAHNGAGYDTRLVFNDLIKNHPELNLNPLMKGSKFIQLTVEPKIIFRDSYLHICGSLKRLAIDFLGPGVLEKGYFPHKFNKLENYDYVGPIPDKKCFDFSTFKDDREWNEFNTWYDSWQGDWNFKHELFKYCHNDVEILAKIVKLYNEILIGIYDISPWLSMTAASYGHKISLNHVTMMRELDPTQENYHHAITDRAYVNDWAVLTMSEYYMVRNSLRGGRTDIRKLYTKLTPEEIERGCKIVYQDLCSQYPYQQVAHDFPVGLPTIYAYDDRFIPCKVHNFANAGPCDCPENKRSLVDQIVVRGEPSPTKEDILNDASFFGYICASVRPPKDLYHPVLIHYDQDEMKCKASCEDIIQGYFTSIEFVTALRKGYEILEIFRYDKYNKLPSFWADTIKPLFLGKMLNSRSAPTGQELEQLLNDYDQFDMRDMILDSLPLWGKNPAKKATFKIMMNSGWGKHAQKPVLQKNMICNYALNENGALGFFLNLSNQKYTFDATVPLTDNIFMYKYKENGDQVKISLDNSYLPAACFVPAYGRLQLWSELDKLGDRVLMNDTDSIVYIYDPEKYNIPASTVWGGWEIEHDSIVEFIGMGPKTYAFKKANGEIVVKNKGIRMSRATNNLINFDRMKEMVLVGLATGDTQKQNVPQTLFAYKPGKNIQTTQIIKELSFSIRQQKGIVDVHGKIYPVGFDTSLFEPHPMLN